MSQSKVLHALPEQDEKRQDLHMRHWYGTVQSGANDDLEDEGSPVVCWCGGRRHWLDNEVSVVWHLRPFFAGLHGGDPHPDE